MTCTGKESSVKECSIGSVGRVNCVHGNDVSINCRAESKSMQSASIICHRWGAVTFMV